MAIFISNYNPGQKKVSHKKVNILLQQLYMLQFINFISS